MYHFQRDSNTILLVISVVQLGWSSSLTFIPCELSERISIAFFDVCDAVDELDFYLFPIGMQKMLPIVLLNSQAPIALRCFGSVFCGRDVFKKVCAQEYINSTVLFNEFFSFPQMNNTSCSYFMVLRQFSE